MYFETTDVNVGHNNTIQQQERKRKGKNPTLFHYFLSNAEIYVTIVEKFPYQYNDSAI